MSDLKYRVVEVSDTAKVREFLIEHFFKDEPISSSRSLVPGKELLDAFMDSIPLKCNTLAEDSEGNIAGIRLAHPRFANDKHELSDDKYNLLNFIAYLAGKSEDILFKEMKIEKCLQGSLLCVDKAFRGQGIGIKLYSENMALGKSLGYEAYICDCSSLFSAKLCEKLDMTNVFQMNYSEYVDDEGKPMYTPEPPHDIVRIFIKRL